MANSFKKTIEVDFKIDEPFIKENTTEFVEEIVRKIDDYLSTSSREQAAVAIFNSLNLACPIGNLLDHIPASLKPVFGELVVETHNMFWNEFFEKLCKAFNEVYGMTIVNTEGS